MRPDGSTCTGERINQISDLLTNSFNICGETLFPISDIQCIMKREVFVVIGFELLDNILKQLAFLL